MGFDEWEGRGGMGFDEWEGRGGWGLISERGGESGV